jgi:ABC-2 type transport system permease protein
MRDTIRRVFVLAANDWRLALRDRRALLWMLFMPLLFTFVFGSVFGRSAEGARRRSMPVVVEDRRFLGGEIAKMLEDVNWAVVPAARGDSLLAETGVWVEIPSGFTDSVLSGGRGTIRIVEGSDGSPERREAYAMNAWKASIRALTCLADVPDSARTGSDDRMRFLFDSLASRPDLVGLTVREAAEVRPRPAGFLLAVPGNLVMFVLIVALTSGAANIASEAARGHFRRLGSSPLGRHEVYLGKLAGSALIALTQIAFLVLAATLLFRMDWGDDPVALALLLLVFGFVVSSIGVFLGLVIPKPETAAAAGVLTTLVFASLGGCWWPLEIVPETMRRIGHVFPTAWAMDALLGVIAYGNGTAATLPFLLILAAYGILFATVGARLIRFDR